MKETIPFEEAMTRLEQIVNALERGDAPLEESLKLFQEGAGLIRHCTRALDEAQQQVKLLTVTPEGLEQTPFGETED